MFTRLEQTQNGTYKYQKEDINRDLMISLAEISIDLRANATSISKSLDNLHLKKLLNSDWLKEWCILSPEIF